jgi:hypothetical protein
MTDSANPRGPDGPLVHRKIREWFQKGKAEGFRYLLICQDTFDAFDGDMGLYPHFCNTRDEAQAFEKNQLTGIDVLVEVVDLHGDMEEQFSGPRRTNLSDLA